jgi:hypothetical protein
MAVKDEVMTFMIEDAELYWRNFSGKEDMFNAPGNRNFGVFLEPELAAQMAADGWSIGWTKPRDDEPEGRPYISVNVKYRNRQGQPIRPPRIVMLTSRKRNNLGEDDVDMLDWVNVKTVDIICRASHWNVNGKTGVKAYLQSMFLTIEEDYLERKYAMNESAMEDDPVRYASDEVDD